MLLLLAAHGTGDFYATFVAPLLPYFRIELGLTLGGASILGAMHMAVSNYLQPILGLASEGIGRRRLMAGGVFLATAISLAGLGNHVVTVGALLVLGAVGVAAFHPAGAALAGELGEERRSSNIAAYMVGGNLGVMVPPLLIPRVARFGMGWVALLAIPGIIFAIMLYRYLPVDDRHAERPRVTLADIREMFRHLWPIHLDVVLRFFALNAYTLMLPLLGTLREQDQVRAGYSLAFFMFIGAVGVMAGGRLAERFRERPFLIFGEIVGGICLILAPTQIGLPFYLLLGIGGFLMFAVTPMQIAAAQRLAPKSAGAASGVVMGLAYGNASLLLFPLGWLGNHWTVTTGSELTSLVRMLQFASTFILLAGALAFLTKRRDSSPTTESQGH